MQEGNTARFVNDFRGIETTPNVRFTKRFVCTDIPVVFLEATRDISRGDEILADYGDSFWSD
jgi:hypothetical protein